jgi:hypothetical protein
LTDVERENFRITVAHVHPIDELTGGRPRAVRSDSMPRYLHLPAEDAMPELVADLWLEQPVRVVDLLQCSRVASLSPEWRYRLWWKIIRLRLGQDYRRILQGENPDAD